MEMYHQTEDGKLIQYELKTDPPEAIYWTTFRLLKSHIRVLTKLPKEEKTLYRTEIYDDIISREPNNRSKSKSRDALQKERQAPVRVHIKARKKQRQTG